MLALSTRKPLYPNHKNKPSQWTCNPVSIRGLNSTFPPMLVVFTDGTKLNPEGLQAFGKQHRVPCRGLHPDHQPTPVW